MQVAVLLCVFAGLCQCAFGLNPSLDINQYAHRAWTVRDGFFKGGIYAIAQTPDGYLWVGNEFGLDRFDGVQSVPWRPPNNEQLPGGRIRSLLAARDGWLWIGTDEGLASWKDGKLTHFAELDGQYVLSLLEDQEGTVWAAGTLGDTEGRLCAIRRGHAECYGKDGSLGRDVISLYQDRNARLWVGTMKGVWQWRPGPSKFLPSPEPVWGIAEEDGGELLIATAGGIRKLVDGRAERYPLGAVSQRFDKLLRDREGGLWVGTADAGLLHVHQGRIDRFAQSDGLSGDFVYGLFQDREGSIWAATNAGLDRFREFAIPTLTTKQGLSTASVNAVLAARDGSIWVGTQNGLDRWKSGQVIVYGKKDGLPDAYVYSLSQDRAARIWVSTDHGSAYFHQGRLTPVPGLPAGFPIVADSSGDVWLSTPESLFHLRRETAVEEIPWIKLGGNDRALAMVPDPARGGVWLGFLEGGVAYFKDGQKRAAYGRADGLGEGRVSGLSVDEDGILWAATQGGLSHIKNGRVLTLSTRNGLPCNAVHWALEDDDHFFWLYTACGLVRITRKDINGWTSDSGKTVEVTVFDNTDGVRMTNASTRGGPAKSADGNIWFVTGDGVSVLDPRHLPVNKLPPPVHVEQIIADRKVVTARRLPALTRDLEIEYAALSLVAPERNRFKYKLEGYDRDWQDAGNRRQAFYTNLPPRSYRFRVIASNNSGVWNENGDTLEFSIAPAYYQTNWFRASMIAAFFLAVFGLYRLRLLQISREFNAQLEGRVDERLRVARELHDTLLQSFQGMMPFLQAARNKFAKGGDGLETLDQALGFGAQAIAEGREAIQGMRSSTTITNDLARAIQAVGDELKSEGSAEFRVLIEGSSRDLHPILRDEVYGIAREAIRNAFHHAEAKAIEAEIAYRDDLRVRIRDDGKGIDPEIAKEGRSGHYGMAGMRERAGRIGGKLTVWSAPGAGTEIELRVPGSKAFSKSGARSLAALFRRGNGERKSAAAGDRHGA